MGRDPEEEKKEKFR